ncbi:efflux RND transporter periplasmic adaptor subunit [Kyrpidia spormannii]|uniref:Putative membrane fusion protein putative exporter subunit (Benzoate transcriptome) n=2 Tax=Kyrpidia spormannii TaxID=2055160 RepID=A0A6F9EB36_9BACL|nr:putative membrane fusion protein; putative exporter subunit (benzoate transcriptome) [Kyrpidia spormannii]CAB3394549.1 putative membrane fusion protein; putative exporter subunit (benzoate transcriptome) [Kyrpidia spormannii]
MTYRRLLIINIVVIFLVIIAGFVAYYLYNQSILYITTDNAEVTGQQIPIAAPATGKLTDWHGNEGQSFQAGATLGHVQVSQGNSTVSVPVTMPQSGIIALDQGVDNGVVAAGTPLAYTYDLNNLWVTANIKETQVNDIKPGQSVDVYVDSEPGISLKGRVASIGDATAAIFSLLPQQTATADYTKVT